MSGTWAPDPSGRNQLRWFNGSVWTEHVSNNGRVAVDPMSTATESSPREKYRPEPRDAESRPVGVIGGLAGIGAGYAVLVYLGIPSGILLFFFPPVGIVMCGLTIWLALRASRRVSRATQRGVDAASARLAQFLAEFRSYESKWGTWTPPDSDGTAHGDHERQQSEERVGNNAGRGESGGFGGESTNRSPSAHAILGVREGASPKEVRAAFHRLMLAVHPDRHVNKSLEERARMEDQAKVITEAYNALKN